MKIHAIKTVLNYLVSYYEGTRQAGHTTLMREGIDRKSVEGKDVRDCVVLVHDARCANSFRSHATVTLSTMDRLRGRKEPLAIDNCALHMLFLNAVSEITRLEALADEVGTFRHENISLHSRVSHLLDKNDYLAKRVASLELQLCNAKHPVSRAIEMAVEVLEKHGYTGPNGEKYGIACDHNLSAKDK